MKMVNELKENKHLNNKGFSLIELMVVVAIMAIMIGVGVTSYRTVSRTNVKKSARYVDDYLSLAREKARTISAYEWNMTIDATQKNPVVILVKIEKDDLDNLTVTQMSKETLPSNVKLSISDADGNVTEIGGSTGVKKVSIVFKSLTGTVDKIYFEGEADNLMTKSSFYDILCKYKSREQVVRLYDVTGKHTTKAY